MMARFGVQKEEVTKEETKPDESENGSGSDNSEAAKPEEEALDIDGSKLLDSKGRGMVRICEDEDGNDICVKQEMDEIHDLGAAAQCQAPSRSPGPEARPNGKPEQTQRAVEDACQGDTILDGATKPANSEELSSAPVHSREEAKHQTPLPSAETEHHGSSRPSCTICSLTNEPSALVCVACSNVLQPRRMPGHWRCHSSVCGESRYINAGDCGVCGVCGSQKPNLFHDPH